MVNSIKEDVYAKIYIAEVAVNIVNYGDFANNGLWDS